MCRDLSAECAAYFALFFEARRWCENAILTLGLKGKQLRDVGIREHI